MCQAFGKNRGILQKPLALVYLTTTGTPCLSARSEFA
jgi:hypothetical protein